VVDNDVARSAEPVCGTLANGYRWRLRYEVEPRRGIPLARNRAVTCVVDRVDAIAFIDDDATPEPNWLDELLEVKHRYEANIVTGPWTRRFGSDAPAWLKRGRWLQPRRYPTGHRLNHAITCNVMVDVAVFQQMETWFDPQIGLGGGSDRSAIRTSLRPLRSGSRPRRSGTGSVHDFGSPNGSGPSDLLCLANRRQRGSLQTWIIQ
jgi:succinoglycan biosynthesis protein ExoM